MLSALKDSGEEEARVPHLQNCPAAVERGGAELWRAGAEVSVFK